MVISPSADPSAVYSSMFRTYIIRNTEFALTRVQNAVYSLSTEDQKLVFKTLNYALKYDDTWFLTRDLLMSAAPKMEQAGYRGEWMLYLESGIQQSKRKQDLFAEATLHFNVGILYKYKAEFNNARLRFNKAAIKFQEIACKLEQARALNHLAYVARLQRRFEEAKQIVEVAQTLAGDDIAEVAYSYLVRGSLALDQGDWQNASSFFEKSLTLWKKTKDKRKIAWGLSNLGTALRVLKEYDKAILSYEEGIRLFEEVKDPVHQAVAQMNLGNVYLNLGEAEKALPFYNLSESIFYDTQAWLRFAKVNHNKAIAHQQLKHWYQAECAYLSSIEQWRKLGSIGSMVRVIISLAEMYIEQGLPQEARKSLQNALHALSQMESEPEHRQLLDLIRTMQNSLPVSLA